MTNLPKVTTYKTTIYNGATPEQGTEWWTEEDWARHEERVKKFKEDGTYLEPQEVELSLVDNPVYDQRHAIDGVIPTASSRFVFLDFSTSQ